MKVAATLSLAVWPALHPCIVLHYPHPTLNFISLDTLWVLRTCCPRCRLEFGFLSQTWRPPTALVSPRTQVPWTSTCAEVFCDCIDVVDAGARDSVVSILYHAVSLRVYVWPSELVDKLICRKGRGMHRSYYDKLRTLCKACLAMDKHVRPRCDGLNALRRKPWRRKCPLWSISSRLYNPRRIPLCSSWK